MDPVGHEPISIMKMSEPGGGNSNILEVFHPDMWGRWTQFDEHIFQLGWFNHQLEKGFWTLLIQVLTSWNQNTCGATPLKLFRLDTQHDPFGIELGFFGGIFVQKVLAYSRIHPHTIHVWYIYLHEWLISMGKL